MEVSETSLKGVTIFKPDVFEDNRGFFLETYHREKYRKAGISSDFVQDNLSFSAKGTIRGLHYQQPHAQAKLIQVIQGEIYDVAVDIRRGSPSFGQWIGVVLSGGNRHQLSIPEGYAHGYCVLSETAFFMYKCSDFYFPECEGGVIWSDPDLGIEWPVEMTLISDKDRGYPRLKDVPEDRLPLYNGTS